MYRQIYLALFSGVVFSCVFGGGVRCDLTSDVHGGLLENIASEFGARYVVMQNVGAEWRLAPNVSRAGLPQVLILFGAATILEGDEHTAFPLRWKKYLDRSECEFIVRRKSAPIKQQKVVIVFRAGEKGIVFDRVEGGVESICTRMQRWICWRCGVDNQKGRGNAKI